MSLLEFASCSDAANGMSKRIDGCSIENFDYVGITEHFNSSLELFSKIFSVKNAESIGSKKWLKIKKLFSRNKLILANRRASPERKNKFYDLSEQDKAIIIQHNAKDMDLYNRGLKHFETLCKKHGITISD